METCVKQGNLNVLVSGTRKAEKWQTRFYVLRGFTATTKAQFECYTTESTFKCQQRAEYTYCFDDIADISYRERPGASSEYKHSCEIRCKKKVLVFSAPTPGEMQGWVIAMTSLKFESDQRKEQTTNEVPRQNVIYEPLGIASRLTVPVNIEATDASKRCRLGDVEYLLHVCRSDMILMDSKSKEMKQQWQYRFIRTYTCTPSVFSFEAGRCCASGEGLFSFKTPMAVRLNAELEDAVQALQNTERGKVEDLYMSMTCDQKNIAHSTTATSTIKPAAQRVCYENVPTGNKMSVVSQSTPVTDSTALVSKQRHTEDTTEAKSTKTSGVQRVCYENIPADVKPLSVGDRTLAGGQTDVTQTPAVQRVCYENVSTTSSAQTSQEWIFMVEVEETEASRRCKLNTAKYQLYFDTACMKLENPTSEAVLQLWPYNVIRRYGCSQDLFAVEVGRRAPSGEGLFKFKTTTPDTLKTTMKIRAGLVPTNSSAYPSVERPSQREPTGPQQHGTQAVDDQRVNEYEAPSASTARQQPVRYETLERPSVGMRGVHSYMEVVAEPTNLSGGSH